MTKIDPYQSGLAAAKPAPVFEIGKRYRMRGGGVAGPLEMYTGDLGPYAFRGKVAGADVRGWHTWQVNGSWNHPRSEREATAYDLLPGAIEDEPAAATAGYKPRPVYLKTLQTFYINCDMTIEIGPIAFFRLKAGQFLTVCEEVPASDTPAP